MLYDFFKRFSLCMCFYIGFMIGIAFRGFSMGNFKGDFPQVVSWFC